MKITLGLSKNDVVRIYEMFRICDTLEYIFDEKDEEELTEEEKIKVALVSINKDLLERIIGLIRNEEMSNGFDPYVDDDPLDGMSMDEFILRLNAYRDSITLDVNNDSSGGVLSKEESACFEEIITEVADNGSMNIRNKIPQQEVGDAKIPVRQRILSNEEKKNLTDKEVFMEEFGLYTNFVLDDYWSNVFREIYGYSPSLL